MPKAACHHGSVSRLALHLHWCPSCASWRHYSFRSYWRPGRRGALARWSDAELLGMGEVALEGTDPEELLAFMRQLLLRCQAVELEERQDRQGAGDQALLARLLERPRFS